MTNSEAQDALRRFAGTRDPAAFEQLVKGHIDLVYAAARRQVSDSATADDVTQQVFVLLASKAAKLSDAVRLPGWLLRTCRHCAADANRARLRRQHHEQEAAAMKSQTAPIDPDTQEILRQVDAALADLGETDRAAIAMRYLQQRSVREVADALKVSEGAAKKRLSRAMERLRGRLAPMHRAITVTVLAAALEQAASITAPPAMASTIATTAVASKVAVGSGLLIRGIAAWKIGVIAAVILLSVGGMAIWLLNGPSSQPFAVNPTTRSTAGVKLQPMPGVASLTPQQRRIYQLLSEFRTEVPFQADNWVAALRELTQIGAPAVPALCAELDRTDRDTDQRLLIMALRIIDDPRAVPSLIRAIPRVAMESSDYGVRVTDPSLRAFLDSHYWEGKKAPGGWQTSDLNRGITECIAALEAITHHSEGHDQIMKFDAEGRQQLADRWMQWWAEHADSSVDLSSIDAVRYDGDLVAAVGVATATTPALFPTGPQIHLSPIREVDIAAQGTWDIPALLNLSTGKVLCQYQDSESEAGVDRTNWIDIAGIDVTGTAMKPTSRGKPPWQAVVDGYDMKTWKIDNARFDKIEDEVRGTGPILHDARGPIASLVPEVDRNGMFKYPVTFLIRTWKKRCGILQEVGPVEGRNAVRIRYRLWPEGFGATQPASQAAASQPDRSAIVAPPSDAVFGPTHEVTLFSPQSGQPASLNLQTGKTFPQTIDVNNPSWTDAKSKWVAQSQIDLSTMIGASHALVGLAQTSARLVSGPVSDEAWDRMSPQTCETIAARARLFAIRNLDLQIRIGEHIPGYSETWVVSYPDSMDVIGLFQIVDMEPAQLKLRYKLIELPVGK